MKVIFLKDNGHFKKGDVRIQMPELAKKNIADGVCKEYVGITKTEVQIKELIKNDLAFKKIENSTEEE